MKFEILTKFKGIINNIEFDNQSVYNSTLFILENIENNFGECYTDEFVKDLKISIFEAYLKYYFSFEDFENYMYFQIEQTKNFKDLIISYEGYTNQFNSLNEKIRKGDYLKNEI